MKNKLLQHLVAAGSVLLKKTFVQYLLVTGACLLLYSLTSEQGWIIIGLIYAVVILIIANRRAGGPRGTSDGPAGGPVDFGGNGGGNGG
jgi:hypothetical protein